MMKAFRPFSALPPGAVAARARSLRLRLSWVWRESQAQQRCRYNVTERVTEVFHRCSLVKLMTIVIKLMYAPL